MKKVDCFISLTTKRITAAYDVIGEKNYMRFNAFRSIGITSLNLLGGL